MKRIFLAILALTLGACTTYDMGTAVSVVGAMAGGTATGLSSYRGGYGGGYGGGYSGGGGSVYPTSTGPHARGTPSTGYWDGKQHCPTLC